MIFVETKKSILVGLEAGFSFQKIFIVFQFTLLYLLHESDNQSSFAMESQSVLVRTVNKSLMENVKLRVFSRI